MSKEVKIAYEPHPVSQERKAELRQQGFKIVDARFDPKGEKPEDLKADDAARDNQASDDAEKANLDTARADYEAKFGKKPFNGWGAKTLREKIAAA